MTFELLAMAGLVLAADQVSKALVVWRLPEGRRRSVVRSVQFRRVLNTNGIRRGGSLALSWGVTVLAAVLLASLTPALRGHVGQMGMGAAVGGATGNVLDRLRWDGVVDFIDLRIWPVFNLADAAIVFGVGAILWSMA